MQKLSTLQDVDEKYRAAIDHEYKNLAKAKLDYKVKSKSINAKIAKKLFSKTDPKSPQEVNLSIDSNIEVSLAIDSNLHVDEKQVVKKEVAPKLPSKRTGNEISLSLACVVIVISVAYVVYLSMYN